MLRDLGVQLVVVPFDLYLALESNHSAAIRADFSDPTLLLAGELSGGGELALTVVDPINELLETDRDDDGTPAEVAVHLFADLMAMRLQLGPDSRSFMLATPDLGIPDPDVLAVIEGFVAEHPDVGFQTLSFVPGRPARSSSTVNRCASRSPRPPAPTSPTACTRSISSGCTWSTSQRCCRPTIPRPPRWRTELEALMSTGIDDADGRPGGSIGSNANWRTIEQAIQPPAPFTFTLAGEASTITLRFGNTSTTALRIGVRVSGPSRLAFPQPDTEVTLEPGVITDVTIPIEARSNGTSEVVGRGAHAVRCGDRRADRAHRPRERLERPRSVADRRRAPGARDVVVQPLPPHGGASTATRQPAVAQRASQQSGIGHRAGIDREHRSGGRSAPIADVRASPRLVPLGRPTATTCHLMRRSRPRRSSRPTGRLSGP